MNIIGSSKFKCSYLLPIAFLLVSNLLAQNYITRDGSIRIVGYNDMRNSLESINVLFHKQHPNYKFYLDLRGTKTAPLALANGTSAFAPMGSEMTEEEKTLYKNHSDEEVVMIRVAHASLSAKALSGPVAIIVNKDNPLNHISIDQLHQLYTPDINQLPITTWEQLEDNSQWSKKPIHILGLSKTTALGEYLIKKPFMGKVYNPTFKAYSQSIDVFNQVMKDPLAIGFCRYNIIDSRVKVLGIINSNEVIYPTQKSIKEGTYPLDRYLVIYIKANLVKHQSEWIKEYLELVLSKEGQEAIAHTPEHYIPLNNEEIRSELVKVKNL